jgi:hypothetical protein
MKTEIDISVSGLRSSGEEEEEKARRFITQCVVLTRRSFVNMYRDMGYYWLRLAIYVALSLGLATLFYDLGSSYGSIQVIQSLMGNSKFNPYFKSMYGIVMSIKASFFFFFFKF